MFYQYHQFCPIMKTREVEHPQSTYNTDIMPKLIGEGGYIDITPYQQKGDPCYGGDTGETEYENYMLGTCDSSKRHLQAQVHTKSGNNR